MEKPLALTLGEPAGIGPDILPLQFERREETRKRRRRRDGHWQRRQSGVNSIEAESLSRPSPLHNEAVTGERAQATLTQIRR